MSPTPKISVVTIVYNGAESILATMDSVINQSYPHIEYILIDGLSTDNTRQLIESKIAQIADITRRNTLAQNDTESKRTNFVDSVDFIKSSATAINDQGCIEEIIRLKLFLFSLKDKAKHPPRPRSRCARSQAYCRRRPHLGAGVSVINNLLPFAKINNHRDCMP